ncbi:MAG TPA: DNA sulfur modification protein DndE [Myxococcota bacterium]|nr:DNA sulfur modification protein DndE [Myxococcota bacterium]
MEGPVRSVKISVAGREQLIRLKRYTKIEHWNVLCRWALCRSLAEEHAPRSTAIREWSNVEMTWPVFAGPYGDIFLALLRQRCVEYGLEVSDEVVAEQFRLHLHRGLATLAASGVDINSIQDLVRLALHSENPQNRHAPDFLSFSDV